jgi:hypothetical protein
MMAKGLLAEHSAESRVESSDYGLSSGFLLTARCALLEGAANRLSQARNRAQAID